MDRPLTAREAADRLGLSPESVRKFAQRGTIKAEKIGRDWLIHEREIAWYELRRERPRGTRRNSAR